MLGNYQFKRAPKKNWNYFLPVRHIALLSRRSRLNMQLLIRSERTYVLDVENGTPLKDVAKRVAEVEGVKDEEIALYCNCSPVVENAVVESLPSSIIEVLCGGLLGGKVHGSLARAGKVKGQTPKVEKQEKRKKKTGRAKRRIQYNRRFVNYVEGFGRRRGPNSNS